MFILGISKDKLPNLSENGLHAKYIALDQAHISIIHNENELDFLRVDSANKTVRIEPDPCAGRVIYYCEDSLGNIFISNSVVMLNRYGIPLVENLDVLPELLAFGCVVAPNTMFQGINLLGCLENLEIIIQNNEFHINTIRIIKTEKQFPVNDHENIYQIFSCLKQEVSKFQDEPEKVTTLFSGGTDSSLVARLIQKNLKQAQTFSTDYPRDFPGETGEEDYAQSAAEAMNLDNVSARMAAEDYFMNLIETIDAIETPVFHLQSVLLYDLFKNQMPSDIRYIFSGQSADTIAGCDAVNAYLADKREPYMKYVPFKKYIRNIIIDLHGFFRKGWRFSSYFLNKYYSLDRIDSSLWHHAIHGNIHWVKNKFNLSTQEIFKSQVEIMKPYVHLPTPQFAALQGLFIDTYMTQVVWRKIGEVNGKLLVFPFINKSIVQDSLNISPKMLFARPKNLIWKLGSMCHVPDFIFKREKKAFSFDIRYWGGKKGLLVRLIEEMADGPHKDLYKEGLDADNNKENCMTLWHLLNYYIWRKIFIENEKKELIYKKLNAIIQKDLKNDYCHTKR